MLEPTNIKLVSPTTSPVLATPEQLAAYSGSSVEKANTRLQFLAAASESVRRYCNRQFHLQTWELTYNCVAAGSQLKLVGEPPLKFVSLTPALLHTVVGGVVTIGNLRNPVPNNTVVARVTTGFSETDFPKNLSVGIMSIALNLAYVPTASVRTRAGETQSEWAGVQLSYAWPMSALQVIDPYRLISV